MGRKKNNFVRYRISTRSGIEIYLLILRRIKIYWTTSLFECILHDVNFEVLYTQSVCLSLWIYAATVYH